MRRKGKDYCDKLFVQVPGHNYFMEFQETILGLAEAPIQEWGKGAHS